MLVLVVYIGIDQPQLTSWYEWRGSLDVGDLHYIKEIWYQAYTDHKYDQNLRTPQFANVLPQQVIECHCFWVRIQSIHY